MLGLSGGTFVFSAVAPATGLAGSILGQASRPACASRTDQFVTSITEPFGGSRTVRVSLSKPVDMPIHKFAPLMVGVLSRLHTAGLQFLKAEVTVKTYALVVIPLAFGAFLIALLIPETSAFVP
jgi:hypothetical protein